MIRQLAVSLSTILVLVGFNCGAWAQSAPSEAAQGLGGGVGSPTVVTLQGKIVDVNMGAKQVTLEAPNGQKLTVDVLDPDNLRAAKVGEPFTARYYDIVTVRKKQPGETVQNAVTVGHGRLIPLEYPVVLAQWRQLCSSQLLQSIRRTGR